MTDLEIDRRPYNSVVKLIILLAWILGRGHKIKDCPENGKRERVWEAKYMFSFCFSALLLKTNGLSIIRNAFRGIKIIRFH